MSTEMNMELREQHMKQLTDPETGQVNPMVEKMYDALCAACLKRPEGLSDQDQMMVADIVNMEVLKQQLYEDIRTRGVVEDFRNGRQKLKRDNKSVQGVRMLMDQQRKHLAELRLTPNSRKAAPVSLDDGFEDFYVVGDSFAFGNAVRAKRGCHASHRRFEARHQRSRPALWLSGGRARRADHHKSQSAAGL